jgi:hypothetical protein
LVKLESPRLTNADGTLQFDRAMPIALLRLVAHKRRQPLYLRTAESKPL